MTMKRKPLRVGVVISAHGTADRPHFHSGIFFRSLEIGAKELIVFGPQFIPGKRLAGSSTYGCREGLSLKCIVTASESGIYFLHVNGHPMRRNNVAKFGRGWSNL